MCVHLYIESSSPTTFHTHTHYIVFTLPFPDEFSVLISVAQRNTHVNHRMSLKEKRQRNTYTNRKKKKTRDVKSEKNEFSIKMFVAFSKNSNTVKSQQP